MYLNDKWCTTPSFKSKPSVFQHKVATTIFKWMPRFVHQLNFPFYLLLISLVMLILEALNVSATAWLDSCYTYHYIQYTYICSNSHTGPSLGSWILDNEYCHVVVVFSTPLEDPILNLFSVNCVKFRTACGLHVDRTKGSYRPEDGGNQLQFDVKQYVIGGQLLSCRKVIEQPLWLVDEECQIWKQKNTWGGASGESCSC